MSYENSPLSSTIPVSMEVPNSFSDQNLLLVNVDRDSIDIGDIEDFAISNGFTPKSEYHFTIIGARNIITQLNETMSELDVDGQLDMSTRLNSLTQLLGGACLKRGNYHHVIKSFDYGDEPEVRETLIQEAEVKGIQDVYRGFHEITGIDPGTPFPHLTLFTKGSILDHTKGIGIGSAEVFSTMQHQPVTLG